MITQMIHKITKITVTPDQIIKSSGKLAHYNEIDIQLTNGTNINLVLWSDDKHVEIETA